MLLYQLDYLNVFSRVKRVLYKLNYDIHQENLRLGIINAVCKDNANNIINLSFQRLGLMVKLTVLAGSFTGDFMHINADENCLLQLTSCLADELEDQENLNAFRLEAGDLALIAS